MTAWKRFEMRWCRRFGGQRAGPMGASTSDCVGVPYAIECKRSSLEGRPVRGKWIEQARRNGKLEEKPWLLLVGAPYDRSPTATCDANWLADQLDLAREVRFVHNAEEGDSVSGGRP